MAHEPGHEEESTPFFESTEGKVVGGLGAGLGYFLGSREDAPGEGVRLGYQGEIPDYSLVREQVLDTYDPNMRPGARGKRYFSDFRYMPMGDENALAGIAGVRQDLFDQANVGPDSLRAQNYARQNISDNLPDLGDRGPTGINTVVGAPFDYSQRGVANNRTSKTYTMEDVNDATKTQYFSDGTIYVPDYGFVNIYDAASIAGLTTGYLAPGYTDALAAGVPAGDPGTGDPGEGDPAESFASRDAWGEQATPGSYTEDTWTDGGGWIGKDAEGNLFTAATEQEAMDIIRESTPPSVNDGQNFSTKGEWEAQAIPGSYTEDIWSQQGGWLVINAVGNPSRVATEEEAILAAAGSGEGFKGMNYEYAHPEIQRRMDRGMTYAQAQRHNASTLKQAEGFDANNDGYISLEEWAAYQASLGGTTPDDSPDDPVDDSNPDPDDYNQGGLISLMGGGYLSGSTDGMADDIYTTIDNTQPAALSDGEFVIAADVVSHLGNGNSDAGAEQLYAMMDKIRMDRTGNKNQGKQINPNQYMPRGVA
jgi:hypothetical protein